MADDAVKPPEEKASSQVEESKKGSKSTTVHVKIYAPYKVYFEGQAESITATSQTGTFDILPQHHNFITLLVPCDVIVRTQNGEETVRIQGGIMHVKADSIIVFLDV